MRVNKANLIDEVKRLYYDESSTQQYIATTLGISRQTVLNWLRAEGLPIRAPKECARRGEQNHFWNGGKFIDTSGYVTLYLPEYPGARSGKYVYEHRVVWEAVNNKTLPEGWVIHHLNGIKTDNRPENLAAMSRANHIHQVEPFKKRIRELEAKVKLLEKAMDDNQLMFQFGEN